MLAAFIYREPTTAPEEIIGVLAILLIAFLVVAAFFKWLISGPISPEPWDEESLPGLDWDTPVLCHRCLLPNNPEADFCENCGAAIGKYTNYLPFPYLFSIGHTLRVGTSGEYKRNRLTVWGFVLLSLAEYSIFAPVYLFQFFRALGAKPRPTIPLEQPPN